MAFPEAKGSSASAILDGRTPSRSEQTDHTHTRDWSGLVRDTISGTHDATRADVSGDDRRDADIENNFSRAGDPVADRLAWRHQR